MKKLFFLFAFMGVFAFSVSAQTKACCAKGASAKTCAKTVDKAASADASIVKQVSNEGEVKYVRKEVCPVTGKTTMKDVEYCTKSGKFLNVSPTEAANKTSCTKKASATKVSSTATKVSSTTKKACCAKGSKAACTKKASTTKAETGAKVKLVKDTEKN